MKEVLSMAVVLSLASSSLWAESVKVGWRETGGVSVPAGGSVMQADPVVVGDQADFIKTGGGELVLPLSKLNRSVPSTLTVLDGSLKLTPGADATVGTVTPPAALQKAAFWVAADSPNLVTDGTGVSKWCDVRETNTANPTLPYAKPAWLDYASATRTVAKGVPPAKVTKDGRSAVYFGGSGSGQHMNWCNKSGVETSISGIFHFFVVHGAYEAWGAVLGDRASDGGFIVDAAQTPTYETVFEKGAHFFGAGVRGDMQREFSVVRYQLDGQWFDPWRMPPKKGFQLLAGDGRAARVKMGAFFNQRNVTSQIRQGGDYLSEALVFTNILTEAEKLDVERYLMKKWNLPSGVKSEIYDYGYIPAADGTVVVSTNSTVELAPSANETTDFTVVGEGRIKKSGEGAAVIRPTYAEGQVFEGTLELEAGKVSVVGGAVPAMAVQGGDRLISVPAIDARGTMDVTNWQQTARVDLTRKTDAGADAVVKEGGGLARVNAVADGVRSLTVSDGALVLTSPKVADFALPTDGGAIGTAVPNAGFEEAPESDISLNRGSTDFKRAKISLNTTPYHGWAVAASGDVVSYIFSVTNGLWTGKDAWETWINSKLPPTEGVKALFIKQVGAPYAEVDFPADGDYELSFDATGRYNSEWYKCTMRNEVGIYLGTDKTDAMKHRVGTLVEAGVNPWNRRYFKLENVAKGKRVLMFKSLNAGVDGGTAFDNIKIRYVARPDRTVAFKVPNGDFEIYDVGNSAEIPTIFSPSVPCSNWTFTASSAWNGGLTNGPVGVVSAPTRPYGTRSPCLNLGCDRVWGSTMLAFNTHPFKSAADETKNGFGTATTTFAAPGGTFRLRARLANAATDWDDLANGGTERGSTGTPSIRAVLTRANGTVINLGFISTASHVLSEETWPTSFTLEEGEQVTIALSQPLVGAMAVLDDVVFVSADAGEVLVNGGFENGTVGSASSSWYNYVDKSVYTYGTSELNDYVGRSADYGHMFYEGKRNLNIGQQAGIYQDVTFPKAGLYRLRFAIHSRPNNDLGHNPMRFWLHSAADATKTNEIVRVLEHSTNFVEHSYFFRVPSAGGYRFGVTGCGVDPTVATENRRMIMDGFSIRPVAEDAYAAAPSVPKDVCIRVGEDAKLVLDYAGTITCSSLRIAGKSYQGIVTAADDPEHLSGLGSIEVKPKGMVLVVR